MFSLTSPVTVLGVVSSWYQNYTVYPYIDNGYVISDIDLLIAANHYSDYISRVFKR